MNEIALSSTGRSGLAVGVRMASDERLARLVARGNARAFAVLYARHHAVLYRYCRSIVRDEEDASDALQSALTRAFAALQGGERDVAVRPWLFRIVHNEAISLLRQRRAAAGPVDEQAPAGVSVAGLVEERERFATLVADLQSLPERQRAALVMRELSGLSIEEIAAALSTSPGAAKQTLFEARCALHELSQGRAMDCEAVRETLSERDGRVLRGRKLRAHLRACAGCREFGALIELRSADLRALVPPLPAVTAAGLLTRLFAHGAGSGQAGGAGTGAATTLGAPAAASLTVKALSGAAIAALATAGTAAIVVRQPGHPPARPATLAHSSQRVAQAMPAAHAAVADHHPATPRRTHRGVQPSPGVTPVRLVSSGGSTSIAARQRPAQASHRHGPLTGASRSGKRPPAASPPGHHAARSPAHGQPPVNGAPAHPAPPPAAPADPSRGATGAAPPHASGDDPPPPATGHGH